MSGSNIFDDTLSYDVTHDETAGLQNSTATPGVPGDADDNDIDPASLAALIAAISAAAASIGDADLGAPIGAAQNQVLTFADGSNPNNLAFNLQGGGQTLVTTLSALDGGTITLRLINGSLILGVDATGDVVFALSLEKIAPSGDDPGGVRITIVQYEALAHGNALNPDDFLNLDGLVYVAAEQTIAFADFSSAPAGQNLWTSVQDPGTGVDILVTGFVLGTDTVNTRATSLGSNNQAIDRGEGLVFDFVMDQTAPTSTTAKSLSNIDFTERYEGPEGGFTLVQVGGSPNNRVDAKVIAYNSTETGADFHDGIISADVVGIVAIRVYLGDTLLRSWDGTTASGTGDANVGFSVSGDGVTITGLKANYRVEFDGAGLLDRFSVQNVSGAGGNKSFDLGDIRIGGSLTDNTEVGSLIRFEDDGPSVSLVAGASLSLTVDETNFNTDANGSLAGLFDYAFGTDAFGASKAYSLHLTTDGVSSGLRDTATDSDIKLYKVGDTIEGRAGSAAGPLVFVIDINTGTGAISLDQKLAIKHGDPNDDDESASFSLPAGEMILGRLDVTDGDGDTVFATKDITGAFAFEDDGPSVNLTAATPATLTVDETTLATNDSASFANLFTFAYGNDLAGTAVYSLQLGVIDSGLYDTATDEKILLSQVGDVIYGKTEFSDDTVFTITITPATGAVELDQLRAIRHPNASNPDDAVSIGAGAVFVRLTVTDKDNDSAYEQKDVSAAFVFKDDGPSITQTGNALGNLWVDETLLGTDATASFANQFTSGYGADGAGTTTYALKVSAAGALSGLVDTATGQNVLLYEVGGTIVGRAGSIAGPDVFVLSIASDGTVTLDQIRAVVHGDPTTQNEFKTLNAGTVRVELTVTDKDNDSVSNSVDISGSTRFYDDAPSNIAPEAGTLINKAGETLTKFLDADFTVANNFGNDGAHASGGVVFSGTNGLLFAADGTTQLYSNGKAINVTGYGTDTLTAATTDGTVFTVTLDQASSTYEVEMFAKIDNGSISFDNFGSGGAGLRYWLGVAGNQDATKDLLVTGGIPGVTSVNNDSDDIGANNQWIDPAQNAAGANEFLRLDFVTGIATTAGTSDINNIPVATHYIVNDVGFTVMESKGEAAGVDIKVRAIDAARNIDGTDGTTIASDLTAGDLDAIILVRVIDGTTKATIIYSIDDAVGGMSTDGKVIWNADGSVTVKDMNAPSSSTRDQVFVSTEDGFTRLEIENVDTRKQDAFSIGGFNIGGDEGDPIELAFDLLVKDGDGDTATGQISLALDPEPFI